MSDKNAYENLADALDRLPNGFPRTPSNAEIPLLRKIFSPDEARLASRLTDTPEAISVVAERTGLAEQFVKERLIRMAESGLVWPVKANGRLGFRLAPFVIGIYEAQLTRMDPELAHLIDDYLDAGGSTLMEMQPAFHRVVPAHGAAKPEWILPYEDVRAILEDAKTFSVRDCVCRVHMDQTHRECDFPLDVCLIYTTVERPPKPDDITKDDALDILDRTEEIGLVHTVSNVQIGALLPAGTGYICNCCGCCCMVLKGITKWGIRNSVAHASYFAQIDPALCEDCRNCIDRCQVRAIAQDDDGVRVDVEHCIGCGLCVTDCPSGAATLVRRPDDDLILPPRDFAAWEQQRRINREREVKEKGA